MAIDIGKFLDLYFEESLAAREKLSQSLQGLVVSAVLNKEETLDSAIRAAHIIKGSSGTFGFNEIADLAAALERVFLRIQSHELVMSDSLSIICFDALEELQCLLDRRQHGEPCDAVSASRISVCLAEWPMVNVKTGLA